MQFPIEWVESENTVMPGHTFILFNEELQKFELLATPFPGESRPIARCDKPFALSNIAFARGAHYVTHSYDHRKAEL